MSIDVFPALLSTSKCIVIRSVIINYRYLNNKNLFNRPKLKNLKWYDFSQHLILYITKFSEFLEKNWRKKIQGFDFEEQYGSGRET